MPDIIWLKKRQDYRSVRKNESKCQNNAFYLIGRHSNLDSFLRTDLKKIPAVICKIMNPNFNVNQLERSILKFGFIITN